MNEATRSMLFPDQGRDAREWIKNGFEPFKTLFITLFIRAMGRVLFFGLTWMLCIGSVLHAGERTDGEPKRVLLLNSYHKGYLWTDEITRGVEETLAESGVELHVDYMDTKRRFDAPYQNLMRRMLSLKHQKHRYDVVISSDNNAFDFLKKWGRGILGDVPVVFCGLNYLHKTDMEGLTNYTGVNERMDIAGNLALIRRLHPDRDKVVIVSDNTTTGRKNQEEALRVAALPANRDRRIELVFNVSVDELAEKMRGLDERTVVLFTLFIRDKNEVFLGYDQGMKLVCDNTAAPVYATQNFKPGLGVIGGILTGGYEQGAAAAGKARDILSGKPVSEIPIRWDTPTRPRFDYHQLQRHGAPMDLLPPGSDILNQPVSFYSRYKSLIWNTASVFCLLLLAFFGVVYGLVRSRQAASKLRRNEENLRTTLDSIGDAVIATDAGGGIVHMNPAAERLTGRGLDEAQGEPFIDVFNIVHTKTRETVKNPVEMVLSAGGIIDLADHALLISGDGTERHISNSGAPIRDARGKITGVVLVLRDITGEYKLREQYRNMAFLVASASSAIATADQE
ncbi:MAG: PAS domain-containing protein, partial [Desulfobacterales bacterium]|nr:PAS domain-containing protein [Desulfobacterales bacterium]